MSVPEFDRGIPSTVCGIRVQRDGKVVDIGWASGARIQESLSQFPIDVLGDAFTKQFELVRVRVSGSFDTIRIYKKPLTHQDGRPWPAQTSTPQMIRQYLSTFELYNVYTGQAIYVVNQWAPTDRSISVTTDTVIMENCSFVARSMIEVSPTAPLEGLFASLP